MRSMPEVNGRVLFVGVIWDFFVAVNELTSNLVCAQKARISKQSPVLQSTHAPRAFANWNSLVTGMEVLA